MASDLLPDEHPLRHHTLSMTQVEAIMRIDGLRAASDMAVKKPSQRDLVALSLLLKGN